MAGKRRGWMWALAAGLLLRAAFVWHHPRFAGDTLIYGDLAQNMLRHHVYGVTEDHIRPTLMRLPGYPLFLAACFAVFGDGNYLPVLWVQVAIDLCTSFLLAELARRLCDERVARRVVWLAALCPFTASYAAAALTETPSLFCVTAALLALSRWFEARSRLWACAIGASLAAAVLLRPDQGLLGAAVLCVMAWSERRSLTCLVKAVALPAAIMMLPLMIWAARNWRVFHVAQPLSPKYANDPGEPAPLGFARWYRTWAIDFVSTNDVYWTYDGMRLSMNDLPPRAFDDAGQRERTAALIARYNDVQSSTPELEAAFDALGRERIASHPLRYYVLLPVARLADMWLRPRTELFKLPMDWWRWRAHPARSAVAAAYGLLNVLLLGAAFLGLLRWRAAGWGTQPAVVAAALLFCLLRCGLLLTLDNSEQRYTVECLPVVLLCAGMAFSSRPSPLPKSGQSIQDRKFRSGLVSKMPHGCAQIGTRAQWTIVLVSLSLRMAKVLLSKPAPILMFL